MDKVWTIEAYLKALKNKEISTQRPFDTQQGSSYQFGEKAQSLVLPVLNLDRVIPPNPAFISQLYILLRPILDELVNNPEFDWKASYGSLASQDVAKAYLFNAVNKAIPRDTKNPLSREQFAYQDFLRHVGDALVDDISASKAPAHFRQRPHIKTELDTLVLTLDLQKPNLSALIAYYKSKDMYTMAYKASLFSPQELEEGLCKQMQGNLNDLMAVVKKNHLSLRAKLTHTPKSVLPTSEQIQAMNTLPQALTYLDAILERTLAVSSKAMNKEIVDYVKSNYPFLSSTVKVTGSESKDELTDKLKELRCCLDGVKKNLADQKNKAGQDKPVAEQDFREKQREMKDWIRGVRSAPEEARSDISIGKR